MPMTRTTGASGCRRTRALGEPYVSSLPASSVVVRERTYVRAAMVSAGTQPIEWRPARNPQVRV